MHSNITRSAIDERRRRFAAVDGGDVSLVERLSRNNHFPQALMDNAVDSLVPIDAEKVLGSVADALEEARRIIPRLPMGLAGNLFIDSLGNVGDGN